MPKTHATSTIEAAGRTFTTNALPDTYDLRDLDYRPMLQRPAAAVQAKPPGRRFPRPHTRQGESCTGHAVAATINTVLSRQADELRIPPADRRSARTCSIASPVATTSSAARPTRLVAPRRVQGLAPARHRARPRVERRGRRPSTRAPQRARRPRRARLRRLLPAATARRLLPGQPFRLDDMQSAINELHAIAVSAAIHERLVRAALAEAADKGAVRHHRARPVGEPGRKAATRSPSSATTSTASSSRTHGAPTGATTGSPSSPTTTGSAAPTTPGSRGRASPTAPTASPVVDGRVTTSGEVVISGGPNLTLLRNYVVEHGQRRASCPTRADYEHPVQLDGIFANMAAKHDAWTAGRAGRPPGHRAVGPRRPDRRERRPRHRRAAPRLVAEQPRLPDQLRLGERGDRDDRRCPRRRPRRPAAVRRLGFDIRGGVGSARRADRPPALLRAVGPDEGQRVRRVGADVDEPTARRDGDRGTTPRLSRPLPGGDRPDPPGRPQRRGDLPRHARRPGRPDGAARSSPSPCSPGRSPTPTSSAGSSPT